MTNISFVQPYKYHHPIFADCSIVRCNNCQMVFVDPMPDQALLKEYNAGYFDNAHGGMQTHPLTVAFHSAINLLRVLYVAHFQKEQNISIKTVQEIGPGGGYFAKHWINSNPQTVQYSAVESDKTCHQNLRNIGVDVFSSEEEVPAERQFDLVIISHVLEHTDDPSAFIHHCTKQLRSGGILFIEVPCNDYQHKDSVEPHLLFFDKKPMYLFLTNNGFTNIQITYHGDTIEMLQRKASTIDKIGLRIRNLLLNKGFASIFSGKEKELEGVDNALERAVIKPFKAHLEQTEPAWWLRAISVKN